MTLLVGLDEDGHFVAAHVEDRPECVELINTVWDGQIEDYLEMAEVSDEEELLTVDERKWSDFIEYASQRGKLEIVEL